TSTPLAAAPWRSRLSSTVRRGQKPPRPSFAAIVPRSANGPTSNVIGRQMGGTPVASRALESPQPDSTAAPCGQRMWVDIVSLGKLALSTSNTRYPRRASSMLVGDPAHRAPTTIASYISRLPRLRTNTRRAWCESALWARVPLRREYPLLSRWRMGNWRHEWTGTGDGRRRRVIPSAARDPQG